MLTGDREELIKFRNYSYIFEPEHNFCLSFATRSTQQQRRGHEQMFGLKSSRLTGFSIVISDVSSCSGIQAHVEQGVVE